MYLCPGGLTCCINGRIAAPEPRLDSGPLGSNFMPQDLSFNDNLWADDDSKNDYTASSLAEPSSYDETYDTFLDPVELNLDIADYTNDWASIFDNDQGEGVDYPIQEQLPYNEDGFLNPFGSNSYLNVPSNELSSIFDDPGPGLDFDIPDESLG